MIDKRLLLIRVGIAAVAAGLAGLLVTTLGEWNTKVPQAKRTNEMIRTTFDQNRELDEEVKALTEMHAQDLLEIHGLKEANAVLEAKIQQMSLRGDRRRRNLFRLSREDRETRALKKQLENTQRSLAVSESRFEEMQLKARRGQDLIRDLEKDLKLERNRRAEEAGQSEKDVSALRKKLKAVTEDYQRLIQNNNMEKLLDENRYLSRELAELKDRQAADRVTYFYNLGYAYTQAGLYEEAAQMYEEALKLSPEDSNVHFNLGVLYHDALDRTQEGRKHYEAFLATSRDAARIQQVQTWLQGSDEGKHGSLPRQSRAQSSREAFERFLLTTPN